MKKIKSIIKSFFHDSDGKFQPVYFWVTLLMVMVIATYIMKLADVKHIDNMLFLGILGFVAAWVALYNRKKNGGGGHDAQ